MSLATGHRYLQRTGNETLPYPWPLRGLRSNHFSRYHALPVPCLARPPSPVNHCLLPHCFRHPRLSAVPPRTTATTRWAGRAAGIGEGFWEGVLAGSREAPPTSALPCSPKPEAAASPPLVSFRICLSPPGLRGRTA